MSSSYTPRLNISWTIRCLCANFSCGVPSIGGVGNLNCVEKEDAVAGLGFGDGGSRMRGMGVTVTLSSIYGLGLSSSSFVVRFMVVLRSIV